MTKKIEASRVNNSRTPVSYHKHDCDQKLKSTKAKISLSSASLPNRSLKSFGLSRKRIKVSIVGGSGYAGGELLRILLNHPQVIVHQATSQRFAGQYLSIAHPNLRKQTDLRYCPTGELEKCDLLFVALPNKSSAEKMKGFIGLSPKIIDLGCDFRLKNPSDYKKWYQWRHPQPQFLKKFVYGVAEIHRKEIKKANFVACGGCEATCSILALFPLAKNGLIKNGQVIIDAKLGSSTAGNKPSLGSHHPERSGCVRSYKPTGHRHTAEIAQELKVNKVSVSATAIEMVRGILITAQVFLPKGIEEKDVWKTYRQEYQKEPFIRIVKTKTGVFRYPEPKILAGTNFCDIGFEKDPASNRLVVMAAIDNLVKGTAGQAVQAMNIMMGWDEALGLEFSGLHPI